MLLASGTLRADPVITLPPYDRGILTGGAEGSAGTLAFVAEMNAVAVLGAERLTTFPEVDRIRGNEPELGVMRVGLIGDGLRVPFDFALRLDLSEGLRVDRADFDDDATASVDRFIDDAYVGWSPTRWFGLVAGRHKVPFSRYRHIENAFQTAVSVPFVVDRIAPDRRWGVSAAGDFGSISYALGGFADNDELEVRRVPGDPSTGGRAIVATHVEWTPLAPIGVGYVATPSSDPWHDWVLVSAGMGLMWRHRDPDAGDRYDLSVNGNIKWRQWSAMSELLLSVDGDQVALNAAGEASWLITDRVLTFARADYDIEIDTWSGGGGASYYVTKDRRNKVSFYGFARRAPRDVKRDGAVVQLQASL